MKKREVSNENREKTVSRDKSSKSFTRIALSLVLAVLMFVGMISYENYTLNKHETVGVVRLKADGLKNSQKISKKDIANDFEVISIEKAQDSSNYIHSISEIPEGYVSNDLEKGEILTKKDITEINEKTEYAKDPVEISIKVSDISNDVGGILRTGDMVYISFISGGTDESGNETKEVNLFNEKPYYIDKAIDASGNILTDDSAPATYINLIIDKSEEQAFNEAIVNGDVRMSLKR